MDIHEALAGIDVYSALTTIPFNGVVGLKAYQTSPTDVNIYTSRRLKVALNFCNNFLLYLSDPKKAGENDVHLAEGMEQIFGSENIDRNDWLKKMCLVRDVFQNISNGLSIQAGTLSQAIDILESLANMAKSSISRNVFENELINFAFPGV